MILFQLRVLPINDSMPRVRGGNNVSLEFDLSLLVVVTYKLYNSLAIEIMISLMPRFVMSIAN